MGNDASRAENDSEIVSNQEWNNIIDSDSPKMKELRKLLGTL